MPQPAGTLATVGALSRVVVGGLIGEFSRLRGGAPEPAATAADATTLSAAQACWLDGDEGRLPGGP